MRKVAQEETINHRKRDCLSKIVEMAFEGWKGKAGDGQEGREFDDEHRRAEVEETALSSTFIHVASMLLPSPSARGGWQASRGCT